MLARLLGLSVLLASSLAAQAILEMSGGRTVSGVSAAGDVLCGDATGLAVACDTVSASYASSRLSIPNLTVQPGSDTTSCVQTLDADGGIPVFNVDCTNERIGIGIALPGRQLSLYRDDASGGSQPQLQIEQDGAGDAGLQFLLSGLRGWDIGIDNSDEDAIKFGSQSSATWANSRFAIYPSGVYLFKDPTATTGNTQLLLREGAAVTNPLIALQTDGDVEFMSFSSQGLDVTTGSVIFADSAAVASETATVLGLGNLFHITGTTTITSVTICDAANNGRLVTLIFDGVLTFTDGSNLVLAGDFVTTAADTIQMVCDGTSWHETSRSIN